MVCGIGLQGKCSIQLKKLWRYSLQFHAEPSLGTKARSDSIVLYNFLLCWLSLSLYYLPGRRRKEYHFGTIKISAKLLKKTMVCFVHKLVFFNWIRKDWVEVTSSVGFVFNSSFPLNLACLFDVSIITTGGSIIVHSYK